MQELEALVAILAWTAVMKDIWEVDAIPARMGGDDGIPEDE